MTASTEPPSIISAIRRLGTGTRIAAFFAALFLILGLHLPFLPIWLDWAGLSAFEIAVITATPLFLRLGFAPLLAIYADQHKAHRQVILILAALAIGLGVLLTMMSGFWAIFLVCLGFTLCVATMMPLVETIAVQSVKSDGLDYGRMRLWGSLAFISVGFVGGWMVDWQGAHVIVPMLVLGAVATLAAGWALPRAATMQRAKSETAAHTATAPATSDVHRSDAKQLLLSGVFVVFLLACSAIQGAHGFFYTFGALHWKAQGLSTAWIGALWAIGVLAEVLLFAYSGAAVARLGAVGLMIAGGVAAVARWLVMSFDPGLLVLVPLQILHGLTYGATHLGAIYFMARAIPEGAAGTAQALYGGCAAGVAIGAATLASGPLYAHIKGDGYFVMAAIAALGLCAAVYLTRHWTGGMLWGETLSEEEAREAEIGPKLPVGPNL
ncbi:MAG: MFS transporter [Alphaproteobacteria bacterium]|nr:MFS transporter [Alphaproteobacteria bacterium]